jgi:hypothetical protein
MVKNDDTNLSILLKIFFECKNPIKLKTLCHIIGVSRGNTRKLNELKELLVSKNILDIKENAIYNENHWIIDFKLLESLIKSFQLYKEVIKFHWLRK